MIVMPWFVWKGKNSLADYGLWVSSFPDHTRAEERHEEVEIPGRAGTLTMLEGEDVYSSYIAEMIVTARNSLHIDRICNWLRGSGELILSTEPDRARIARIVGAVSFARIGNDLKQATIPFLCQPFSKSRNPEQIQFNTSSKTIYNPGDVASNPIVKIQGSGANTITIGDMAMAFTGLSGTITVDCDAQIITKNGEIWTGSVTGDYWKIPTGSVTITQTGSATITIDPEWRWF